jgi:hypothetical protein
MKLSVGTFLSTMILLALSAAAQSSAPQKPCAGPEFRQFDFWVGDWDLTWPGQNGQPEQHGHNRIERELGDCVIHEHFSDEATPAFQGTSLSTFTPQLGKWQQTWVDNQGAYMDFTGDFKEGQMVLSRAITQKGKPVMQRMVFKNIKPDSLDWSWERSDDDGATWKVVWPVHYQRRKA